MTPTSGNEATFPTEIFLQVMDGSHDQQSVLAMSSTSQVLRRFGAPRALELDTIIRKEEAPAYFKLLGRCVDTFRTPSLTRLLVSLPLMNDAIDAANMAKSLRSLVSLIDLRLAGDPEDCFMAHPDVPAAIASLPRLAILHVERPNTGTVWVLRNMQGPLQTLRLTAAQSIHLTLDVLGHYRDTLRELVVQPGHAAHLLSNQQGADFDPHYLPQFAEMRRLYLVGYEPRYVGDTFMRMFPELRCLDIGASRRAFDATATTVRGLNLEATRAAWDNNEGEEPWNGIGLVRGGIVDLAALGNTCQAHELEIQGNVSGNLYSLIPEVVEDNGPEVLRLSVGTPLPVWPEAAGDIQMLKNKMESVRFFTLRVVVGADCFDGVTVSTSLVVCASCRPNSTRL